LPPARRLSAARRTCGADRGDRAWSAGAWKERTEMFELAILALVIVIGLAVIGLVASLIWWLFVLPFQILGWLFKGMALLLVLPFVLLAALIGTLVFGAGILVFFFPALPIVLLVLAIWWLARRRRTTAAAH
jgi:hypothetical protein